MSRRATSWTTLAAAIGLAWGGPLTAAQVSLPALPEPVDPRTDEERLADARAAMSCTPYAGELVLAQHGLRQGWLALMAGLPEVDQVRYLRAARWDRADPIMDAALAHLMPALDADARGLALDDMFREAMAIDADGGW